MKWKYAVLALVVVLAAAVMSTVVVLASRRLLAPRLSALAFNGSNRVEIRSAPDLEFDTRPFSVSLWFRTTTGRKNITFISKRANAGGDGWGIFGQGDNQFLFYAAGCSSPMSSPQNYRDGQWHHLAVVRQTGRVDFYYDNEFVGSGPELCDFRDRHPVLIGMDGELGEHFDGELAEVHIYNRALSLNEVAREWNDGKGSTRSVAGSSLVAGYHFDENAGDVAKDFSGCRHDGVLINSPVRTKVLR